MCRECISIEFSILDDASIVEYQVHDIDAIFSGNGGLPGQILVRFPLRLDHSMAAVHVCIQVVGFDPKSNHGSIRGFRVGGWKCLRDVVIKFKKGAVESVSVGEIRLSLRQSLVNLGVGGEPKLMVLISDLEVVMRPSNKSTKKSRSQKSRGSGTSGRGKWMVVANVARFLSISITELVVKTPKATLEVKELGVDISKDGGSKSVLFVKLHILPIAIHLGDPRVSYDQASGFNHGEWTSASDAPFATTEKTCASLSVKNLPFPLNLVMIGKQV
ncbi:hypothetical protein NMG60_11016662 [Bertholletia excelsa]